MKRCGGEEESKREEKKKRKLMHLKENLEMQRKKCEKEVRL